MVTLKTYISIQRFNMIAVILVLFATLGNPEMVSKKSLDNTDQCVMILKDEQDSQH